MATLQVALLCFLLWVEVQRDPRKNPAREHLEAKYGTLVLVCHNEKSSVIAMTDFA